METEVLEREFDETAELETLREMATQAPRYGWDYQYRDDVWLSRCWFGPDAWEATRNADIGRRG